MKLLRLIRKTKGGFNMPKTISTRKNKHYTTIIVNDISVDAFKLARDKYKEVSGNKVIKLNRRAYEDYLADNDIQVDTIKAGQTYDILGTTYHVNRGLNDRSDVIYWYAEVTYFSQAEHKDTTVGFGSGSLISQLIEISFENTTGILLGY